MIGHSDSGNIDIDLSYQVNAGNLILFELYSDTPVDWKKVQTNLKYKIEDVENSVYVTKRITAKLQDRPSPYYVITKKEQTRIRWSLTRDDSFSIPSSPTKVTIAIKGQNKLYMKKSAYITQSTSYLTIDVEDLEFSVDEKLYFIVSSDNPNFKEYITIGLPEIYYISEQKVIDKDNDKKWNTYKTADVTVYRGLSGSSKPFYGGGFRNWYYGRWNGTAQTSLIPSMMKIDPNKIDPDKPEKTVEMIKQFTTMIVDPKTNIWQGNGETTFISATHIGTSRLKQNFIPLEPGVAVNPQGVGVPKVTMSFTVAGGVSGSTPGGVGANASGSLGTSKTKLDIFDLNGDRYPDIYQNGYVNYTTSSGKLNSKIRVTSTSGGSNLFANVRENTNSNFNLGVSGGDNGPTLMLTEKTGDNKVTGLNSVKTNFGISGTAGLGTTETEKDFIDVNGDGLPDRVYRSNGVVCVRYNLGYKFGKENVLDSYKGSFFDQANGSFRVNNTASISGAPSIGFAHDRKAFSGGVSVSSSHSALSVTYQDLNGDGLPDKVYRKVEYDSSKGAVVGFNYLTVRFNTGNGFSEEVEWSDKSKMPIYYNASFSAGASASGTVYISIPYIFGSIIINPGANGSLTHGYVNTSIQDIDGDGYADHLTYNSNGEIKAYLNKIKKTNLLKSISRPLGSTITLDYTRKGNTKAMSQSKWTMTSVEITDGMPDDDGSSHKYTTTYDYKDGYHDRKEREFYGFKTVIEIRQDKSTLITKYENSDYYLKGLEKESVFQANGKIYRKKENILDSKSLYGNVKFPYVKQKISQSFENNSSEGLRKIEEFGYDIDKPVDEIYGNVTLFMQKSSYNSNNDITARITYKNDAINYIVGKPESITVYGGDGKKYRERIAQYNTKGNVIEISMKNDDLSSVTKITYDVYGNMKTVSGPDNHRDQKYKITYSYDTETNSLITSMVDSHGLSSSSSFRHDFGVPVETTDTNSNKIQYKYDNYGRTVAIYGPYDIGSGTPTLAFLYNLQTVPATALTKNKLHWGGTETIDTLTCIDGLSRVVQVQKTSEVRHSLGKTISGKIIFDNMGRKIKQGQPLFDNGSSMVFKSDVSLLNETIFKYDVLGRKTIITYADGSDNKFAFDLINGLLVTTTRDQENKIKKIYKDDRSLIVKMEEFINGVPITTKYKYNPMKEIISVIDDKGNSTTVTYDNLGRRTSIDNPDTGLTQYVFDPAGNVIQKITPNLRAKGQSIKYEYSYSRLDKINYPETNDVLYSYGSSGDAFNRAGRIKTVQNGHFYEERFYGKLGETLKSVKSIGETQAERDIRTFTTQYSFDSVGRMRKIIYPDGETLTYSYDRGGLLTSATGTKEGHTFHYLKDIEYNKYGQRVSISLGNGVKTDYTYDEKTRRLDTLQTYKSVSKKIQNLKYTYDKVGNILSITNTDFYAVHKDDKKTVIQNYTYDDLHRLKTADGTYKRSVWGPDKLDNFYESTFTYDSIGNILSKNQSNQINSSQGLTHVKEKSYNNSYMYNPQRPHAVSMTTDENTKDGNGHGAFSYKYDSNGNMTQRFSTKNFKYMNLKWNEENRLVETNEGSSKTIYTYDDQGQRLKKDGKYGESIYVNSTFSVKSNWLASKHVFAGKTRIATRVVRRTNGGNNGKSEKQKAKEWTWNDKEKTVYYYHSDHLGSSSHITDPKGETVEHLEYMAYGETWIDQKRTSAWLPYKYTGKELDPETGFYYYGARYYDAKLSRWISADPPLTTGGYLPSGNKKKDSNLPGHGGVFNPVNLNAYQYVSLNPIIHIDPDGKHVYVTVTKVKFSTGLIRIVGSKSKRMMVPTYIVKVRDDVTNKTSLYLVTRDAPYMKDGKLKNKQFNPKGKVGKYYGWLGKKTNKKGFVLELRNIKNPKSAKIESDSGTSSNIQIHVGGEYTYKGNTYVAGSKKCMGLNSFFAGNGGRDLFAFDINNRLRINKKAFKGTKQRIIIKVHNTKK